MKYYKLELDGIKKDLPIVSIGPKIKVASLSLLGDYDLVCKLSKLIAEKISKNYDFDYLVGPEVKVVPVLHELSSILGKNRYVVCRKRVHAYMVSPVKNSSKKSLVLDGVDADLVNKGDIYTFLRGNKCSN